MRSVTKRLRKVPVEVNDSPGFVANRILMPMINEAIYTLYEGVATKEDIDEVMKLGMNHPMGPLSLLILLASIHACTLWKPSRRTCGDKYRPCPLLRKYVKAGWLGQEIGGRGFYNIDNIESHNDECQPIVSSLLARS